MVLVGSLRRRPRSKGAWKAGFRGSEAADSVAEQGDPPGLGGAQVWRQRELEQVRKELGQALGLAGGNPAADLGSDRAEQAALGGLGEGAGVLAQLAALAQVDRQALDLLLVAAGDRGACDERLDQAEAGQVGEAAKNSSRAASEARTRNGHSFSAFQASARRVASESAAASKAARYAASTSAKYL